MLFNSEPYVLLLLACAPIYWLVRRQAIRVAILLIASCAFYASWDWRFLPPLLAMVFATYAVVEYGVVRRSLAALKPRGWLIAVIVANLLFLGVFKYTNFVASLVFDAWSVLGNYDRPFEPIAIILPLGISFFTFQLIAYAVDVEAGRAPPERNPFILALFITFFPHMIAGPICREHQLMPQVKTLQPFRMSVIVQGLLLLAAGYLIKVGFADNLAPYVDRVYGDVAAASGADAFWATVAFAFQIFFDFWGYSTMALGSAWLFGIILPANFNLPYIATSFQSFWRRWHMTLSFWLRDYLYVPLGGNRKGGVRTYFNLLAVMLLGGLWHGAALTFVVWGAIHGAALAVERLAERTIGRRLKMGKGLAIAAAAPRWLLTMSIVLIAWVFFRAKSVSDAETILGKIGVWAASLMETANGSLALGSTSFELADNARWYLIIGALATFPLHFIISTGRNQDFFDTSKAWMRKGDTVLIGQPRAPMRRISVAAATFPFPDAAKLIMAFWLFAFGHVLSAQSTTPFIYFQF